MWILSHILKLLLIIALAFTQGIAQDQEELGQNEAEESDSLETIKEGFSGATNSDIDYDALVKELYGKEEQKLKTKVEAAPKEEQQVGRRVMGPAPGLLKNSFMHGGHIAINAASPFAVAEQLYSWYSFIDASLTFKLPFELYVESIPLYLLFEISSFKFENNYPEGGSFSGVSYIGQASAIGDHSGAAIGFGFWDRSMGGMLEANYRFRPTTNTFLRFGTRGVLITDIEPMGAAWWLELRVSTGLEL